MRTKPITYLHSNIIARKSLTSTNLMCKNEKTLAHTQMAQKPYAIIFIRCAVANVNCNCQVKWKKAEKRRTKKRLRQRRPSKNGRKCLTWKQQPIFERKQKKEVKLHWKWIKSHGYGQFYCCCCCAKEKIKIKLNTISIVESINSAIATRIF